jgi:hypothetical protein
MIVFAQRHFRPFEAAEAIGVLRNDVAAFYAQRESSLSRLERIQASALQELDKVRADFTKTVAAKEDSLRQQLVTEQQNLANERVKLQNEIGEERKALAQREKELDDRSNMHARRAIRQELKKEITERGETFHLTTDTVRKRRIIHVAFAFLIGGLAALTITWIVAQLNTSGTDMTLLTVKSIFATLGFVASLIYYIRWNDAWFRQHANEEFRLKRLLLDVDRASWVVETSMEWNTAQKDSIPAELLNRISAGLFEPDCDSKPVSHPAEDALSTILGASSEIECATPNGTKIKIGRKGISQLTNAAEREKKSQ